jgi:hypothetical protein
MLDILQIWRKGLKIIMREALKALPHAPPLELIFCEFYLFEEDARKREMYFKTTMGKKAIKLMLRRTLEKMGYKGSLKPLEIAEDLD